MSVCVRVLGRQGGQEGGAEQDTHRARQPPSGRTRGEPWAAGASCPLPSLPVPISDPGTQWVHGEEPSPARQNTQVTDASSLQEAVPTLPPNQPAPPPGPSPGHRPTRLPRP